jgi:hypothetical protein
MRSGLDGATRTVAAQRLSGQGARKQTTDGVWNARG